MFNYVDPSPISTRLHIVEKTTSEDLNLIHAEFESYITQLTLTSTGEHNSREAGID